jgi:hypothetical protein
LSDDLTTGSLKSGGGHVEIHRMTDTGKLETADTRLLEANLIALEEAARELNAAQARLARTRDSIQVILQRGSLERGQGQWFQESMS